MFNVYIGWSPFVMSRTGAQKGVDIIFKVMYEDPLQLFRTLLGFRNILTQNSLQSAILGL
jgi:hypothetical protein